MLTIKKDSLLRRLITVYGGLHELELRDIQDLCTLSKIVARASLVVLFIVLLSAAILVGIVAPALEWVLLLLLGFSFNEQVSGSLGIFTLLSLIGLSFFAVMRYQKWKYNRETQPLETQPREPTIIGEWISSVKNKYCARIKFEE